MDIDIICEGSDDLNALKSLSCCWPPGVQNLSTPESE